MQKYVKKKRKNQCYKYRELFYKDCCLDTRYTRPFSCKLAFTPCCFRFGMKFLELLIVTQETVIKQILIMVQTSLVRKNLGVPSFRFTQLCVSRTMARSYSRLFPCFLLVCFSKTLWINKDPCKSLKERKIFGRTPEEETNFLLYNASKQF